MRSVRVWWPPVAAAILVALACSSPFWAGEPAGDKHGHALPFGGKLMTDTLKDMINRGAELYNNGDPSACAGLYEGALMGLRPLLTGQPELQKAIDASLTQAKQSLLPSERAFALRRALDHVYNKLHPATGQGSTKDKGVKDAIKPAPAKDMPPAADRVQPKKDRVAPPKDASKKDINTPVFPPKDSVKKDTGKVQPKDNGKVQPKDNGKVQPKDNGKVQPKDDVKKDAGKAPPRTDGHKDAGTVPARDKKEQPKINPPQAKKDAGRVQGKVTLAGQPVSNAEVIFVGQGGKIVATPVQNGNYSLNQPLPAGKYQVAVRETTDPVTKQRPKNAVDIPDRYQSAERSHITVEIQSGPNSFNLDLQKDEKK